MRLSADDKSPYYYGSVLSTVSDDPDSVKVTVDGVVRPDCVEADDAEGWADVIAKDENGEPIVIHEGLDSRLKIERVHGVVAFWWKATKGD